MVLIWKYKYFGCYVLLKKNGKKKETCRKQGEATSLSLPKICQFTAICGKSHHVCHEMT